jgi:hypothetical protein
VCSYIISERGLIKCPLWSALRTQVGDYAMAEKCGAELIKLPQVLGLSFDHDIGALQKRLWNRDTYGLRSFEIDRQLELRGLLYG